MAASHANQNITLTKLKTDVLNIMMRSQLLMTALKESYKPQTQIYEIQPQDAPFICQAKAFINIIILLEKHPHLIDYALQFMKGEKGVLSAFFSLNQSQEAINQIKHYQAVFEYYSKEQMSQMQGSFLLNSMPTFFQAFGLQISQANNILPDLIFEKMKEVASNYNANNPEEMMNKAIKHFQEAYAKAQLIPAQLDSEINILRTNLIESYRLIKSVQTNYGIDTAAATQQLASQTTLFLGCTPKELEYAMTLDDLSTKQREAILVQSIEKKMLNPEFKNVALIELIALRAALCKVTSFELKPLMSEIDNTIKDRTGMSDLLTAINKTQQEIKLESAKLIKLQITTSPQKAVSALQESLGATEQKIILEKNNTPPNQQAISSLETDKVKKAELLGKVVKIHDEMHKKSDALLVLYEHRKTLEEKLKQENKPYFYNVKINPVKPGEISSRIMEGENKSKKSVDRDAVKAGLQHFYKSNAQQQQDIERAAQKIASTFTPAALIEAKPTLEKLSKLMASANITPPLSRVFTDDERYSMPEGENAAQLIKHISIKSLSDITLNARESVLNLSQKVILQSEEKLRKALKNNIYLHDKKDPVSLTLIKSSLNILTLIDKNLYNMQKIQAKHSLSETSAGLRMLFTSSLQTDLKNLMAEFQRFNEMSNQLMEVTGARLNQYNLPIAAQLKEILMPVMDVYHHLNNSGEALLASTFSVSPAHATSPSIAEQSSIIQDIQKIITLKLNASSVDNRLVSGLINFKEALISAYSASQNDNALDAARSLQHAKSCYGNLQRLHLEKDFLDILQKNLSEFSGKLESHGHSAVSAVINAKHNIVGSMSQNIADNQLAWQQNMANLKALEQEIGLQAVASSSPPILKVDEVIAEAAAFVEAKADDADERPDDDDVAGIMNDNFRQLAEIGDRVEAALNVLLPQQARVAAPVAEPVLLAEPERPRVR
ncbi:MAG: hypothetical protein P4M14_01395 [Gammaproteobacteria bacterium]|nr:hypothetical protein [Gammaproteobacteria bacterium]